MAACSRIQLGGTWESPALVTGKAATPVRRRRRRTARDFRESEVADLASTTPTMPSASPWTMATPTGAAICR